MSEKRYSVLDVTEILKISIETLYSWESDLPELRPREASVDGDPLYSEWEVKLIQQVSKMYHHYNYNLTAARHSIERWISKNPRPAPRPDEVDLSDRSLAFNATVEDTPKLSIAPGQAAHEAQRERSERSDHWSDSPSKLVNDVQVKRQTGGRQRSIGKVNLIGDLGGDFDLSPESSASTEHEEDLPLQTMGTMGTMGNVNRRVDPANERSTPHLRSVADARAGQIDQHRYEQVASASHEADDLFRSPMIEQPSSHQRAPKRGESRVSIQQDYPRVRLSAESSSHGRARDYGATSPSETTREVGQQSDVKRLYESQETRIKSGLEPQSEQTTHQADWLDASRAVLGAPSGHSTSYLNPSSGGSPSYLSPLTVSSPYASSQTLNEGSEMQQSEEDENVDWQHAYRHNQAQLARVRGELVRSQEVIATQHREIKQLQVQLLSIREQVLKEMYDLRDLVLDK